MIKFEVGKFYKVQISGFNKRKIPALCTRVTKCTVTFQYLSRFGNDDIRKSVVSRRKRECAEYGNELGKEMAYSPETWSMIVSTMADELCDKPKMWEDVK